jgi:sodium/bile acid cotransporter 7
MVQGIWHQVSVARLGALLAVEAVLLAVMLTLTWYGARALGFGREDRIAIQFAGSKKSLASGLPMAGVLFGTHASLAVLPLMLFHQMQLMVCAVIAKRRARDPETAESAESGEAVESVGEPDVSRPSAGAKQTSVGTATHSG